MLQRFDIEPRCSSQAVRDLASECSGEFVLVYTRPTELRFVDYAPERMVRIAQDTGASMVYADHFNGNSPAPVIDCQEGGVLRDDFDFGGLRLYRTSALKEAASRMTQDYRWAGLYDLT